MSVLSIQSHVAYGHVGNSAAVFALQRLGLEVWPVHTVQFSNHTGYDTFRGRVAAADEVRAVLQGVAERGVLAGCRAVLSGYIGDVAIGEAVLDAVAAVRKANPDAIHACDPVIGDAGRGMFVRPGIAEFMRDRAVPGANLVTPNHFELDFLAGRRSTTLAGALSAVAGLRAMGPQVVLVTSLVVEDTPADAVDLLACDGSGCWRLRTPRLDVPANGAGDLIAALFLARCLEARPVPEALALAAASVFGILARQAVAGAREMPLIAAQEELVAPSRRFTVASV